MHFRFGVVGLLLRTAKLYPDAPAVALGTTVVMTYAQLAERAAQLAAGLRGLGVQPGERAVIFMKNQPAFLEIMLGCWHAGITIVPVNVKLHARELAYILKDCDARILFHDTDHPDMADALAGRSEMHVVAAGSPSYDTLFKSPAGEPVEVLPQQTAWIFYTSGTTGRPKGAMLTHANLLAMTLNYATDVEPDAPGRALLHAAPMSHGSGLYILPHIARASLHICPESKGFDEAEIEELLAVHRDVSFFAAPTMVSRLTEKARGDLPGLHTMIYGGGPMYVADCLRALDRFGNRLVQIYGQGESPMTITSLTKQQHVDRGHPDYLRRLASVGVAQTGVDVRIVDAQGATLSPGETGEIIVKGPTVMAGYWNLPSATQSTLQNGWLFTGDLGSFDNDGFLTLKDRSKDVIISGGTNIYPREIEEILLKHPHVREVAVIGRQDPEWGEVVVAFIVADINNPGLAQELDQLCLQHIARFKRPKDYVFLSALPKNATGKVVKTELRAL